MNKIIILLLLPYLGLSQIGVSITHPKDTHLVKVNQFILHNVNHVLCDCPHSHIGLMSDEKLDSIIQDLISPTRQSYFKKIVPKIKSDDILYLIK